MNSSLGDVLRGLPGPVMITGHTGFKGTWLTFLLEQMGVSTVGLSLAPEYDSLFDRANRLGSIPEKFSDIRNHKETNKLISQYRPSAIIHLAAQPLVIESYKSPRETFNTNVMGTANILEAAFDCKEVRAVIVVTSDKVYRNNDLETSFTEEDALAGKDPYSASKVGAESVVSAWQQIAKISGGPALVSVRAGNVLGGGDWAVNRLLPDLIRGFISEKPVVIRNPESTRPWQHVLDPLAGYLATLESILVGEKHTSLNFGPSDLSLRVRDVANLAADSWGLPIEFEFESNTAGFSSEAKSLNLDSSRARKVLNWHPYWGQAESVIATVNWWKNVFHHKMNCKDASLFDIQTLLNSLEKPSSK